jgi:lysophospholipase L1-like esterase
MTQTIHPLDPRLTWQGIVSLQATAEWVAPWRVQYAERTLFFPERLCERLAMPTGVRIAFHSDTTSVSGEIAPPLPESPVDLCCDGQFLGSRFLADRERFRFDGLPPGSKRLELWLPQFGPFRLKSLGLSDGATVSPLRDRRPRWITYGSSITQCRAAASPTQTWPAVVARNLDLDLFCLGVGGECHLDQVIARTIRDQPADVISLALGINVYGGSTLTPRTFRPAVIGLIKTIRDGHPQVPIIARSAIVSIPREETVNTAGFTLQGTRHEVRAAVEVLQALGDSNLHYVNGLDIFGPDEAHLLPDDVHPNAEGYRLIGERFTPYVARVLGRSGYGE